ncbi:MAG TPA: hypothetical protein VNV37_09720 [Solirubrobacteraceae bacterium]|nr:hypothetical protein [Solirubrobacteraceae bacterium]
MLITERNAIGQVTREVEIERIFSDGSERQTTVRAVGYDTTSSQAHPSMALPPTEARGYIRQAEEQRMLEPAMIATGKSIRLAVTQLCIPGTIDVGLLRQQRDWLLSLNADSPVELAQPLSAGADHLDGLVNLLDAMLDSAEGYPRLGGGLTEFAAGSPADCAARAR